RRFKSGRPDCLEPSTARVWLWRAAWWGQDGGHSPGLLVPIHGWGTGIACGPRILSYANPKTPGDCFFESYCNLNSYLPWYDPVNDPQVTFDGPEERDYLIERGWDRALVEVKHFRTTRQLEKLRAAPGKAMFMESTAGKAEVGRLRRRRATRAV
ncbi:MAG TPA: hypothetical protein VNT27_08110, partial [Propionibacteriaceae bacterium]|nr:hypothetical protein [Propionibacteriaceae bacterium]